MITVRVGLGIGGNVGRAIDVVYASESVASDVGLEVGERVGVTPGTGGGQVESQVE